MEPPKFRIKRVGEEYPDEKPASEEQVDENLPSLESINEATDTESPVLPEEKNTCISCDEELEKDTVICIACGTNQKSGKSLKTKAVLKKKKKHKQKVYKAKKPIDSWVLNLIIFLLLAYPAYYLVEFAKESDKSLSKRYDQCVERLMQFHKKPKKQTSHICFNAAGKNFQLYKPETKEDLKSSNFVKAYCTDHKHGVNIKGNVVKVLFPEGKKVNTPSKFRRISKDTDSYFFGFALIVWGFALNITARFSFCYYALKQGIATFLCCLLIPFYSILFWLNNREDVGPSFICGIISGIMIISGVSTIFPYVLR